MSQVSSAATSDTKLHSRSNTIQNSNNTQLLVEEGMGMGGGGISSLSSPLSDQYYNTHDNSTPSKHKHHHNHHHHHHHNDAPEPEMVDVTYEEKYGEAYVNKPIRYIYPQGYGNMRPRSRPWQLSIVVCIAFAWINVFIVGHCSDRFDWNNYYIEYDDDNNANDDNANDGNNYGNKGGYYNGQYFDDDQMKIETRWCGSRTLYFMWVLSVMITGMSCAYCSIIGYIKARDFSVANNRSQQPGMVGKSDYYVRIEEETHCKGNKRYSGSGNNSNSEFSTPLPPSPFSEGGYQSSECSISGKTWYRKTIYQADGTPRYFGGRIYKPTQAAVNITSR
mmetsp:Transcript_22725/g.25873  ORF Transcript_22725/g.25873 Transcript_22725/m.25873 type:complete len:334 (-) Transcript_22725:274-1275(-)